MRRMTPPATRIGLLGCAAAIVLGTVGCHGPDPEPFEVRGPIQDIDGGMPPDGGLGVDTPESLRTCSDQRNRFDIERPDEDYQQLDWGLTFENNRLRSVAGAVLSMRNVSDPAVIARAVLLGEGDFLDPECVLEQGETSFHWDGEECTPGTLYNTFVVEPETLGRYVWLIEDGTRVRISGYEIDRFDDYGETNRFWMDGGDDGVTGQVSLFLTDICLDDGA